MLLSNGLLSPRPDIAALSERYRLSGCVTIPGFLSPDMAAGLHGVLADWRKWTLVTRIDGQHRGFDAEALEQVESSGRAALDELILAEARKGFQYLYERHPLYDPEYPSAPEVPVLETICRMLRGGSFIELMRTITGAAEIGFADGQLTRYRSGHFLTQHDDLAEGKHRVAAYVLGMTPEWRAEYGGQLQFIGPDGGVEHAIVPGFNTLSLFRVPQPHLVSAVAPFALRPRLSITGWLRRESVPGSRS